MSPTSRASEERDYPTTLRKRRIPLTEMLAITGRMVELNDLYTADHQRRVARLALAIGRELALLSEQLDGLFFAASLHDIGKIYVPEDILNKPNTLSPDEMQVTHNHALAGYYVLSGMRFAWPVAEMVLQHHERLDGSGYPNGLVGDAIMPEARIIAVADVVEATTALRPQRQPLGLPAALSLIAQQEGMLYDQSAVAACLRLFGQQGFRF